MGYEDYETPSICGTIYYDNDSLQHPADVPSLVLAILKKYGYFPSARIEIWRNTLVNDLLRSSVTKHFLQADNIVPLENTFTEGYFDQDVELIRLTNVKRNERKRSDFWSIDWQIGRAFPNGTEKAIYNVLSVDSTYDRLQQPAQQICFVSMVEELATVLNAFYGRIEDVSTSVAIMDKTKERAFCKEYLQTVYWGNYFGKKICDDLGIERLKNIPVENKKMHTNGFFFTLSADIMDSKNSPDDRFRRKIYKYLKPSRKNALI